MLESLISSHVNTSQKIKQIYPAAYQPEIGHPREMGKQLYIG